MSKVNMRNSLSCRLFALVAAFGCPLAALADTPATKKEEAGGERAATSGSSSSTAAKTSSAAASAAKSSEPDHAKYLKDAKAISGLIPLYQTDTKLYGEINTAALQNEYIVLISIARGIGRGSLLGGMSWGFGDDWVWKFRKIGKRIQVVRKNVRFRASKGSPEESAVKNAYTDSVLFSLPIVTTGPKGGHLVDLTPVFMGDLPQISQVLPGFVFSPTKSAWAAVKGFKDNVEIQVEATYASSGRTRFDSVPDTRGVTLNIHYSISKLPKTGYQPRLADDRVGYFVTVVKDYSKKSRTDRFVRYINRWDLRKADPSAKLSPPKEPIIFWIEKTVPFKYRKPIREGILEWNKAFEKAGILNAIEVRQQPDDADWDPEDINYNTFRWITSSAGFAMGPSRVNPYTGQILDADIIFDADFLQYWKAEFETLTREKVKAMTGGALTHEEHLADLKKRTHHNHEGHNPAQCALSHGMARQLALGSISVEVLADPKQRAELQEKLIMQGLKEVTMHEVGHTLGLRHNFKASTWRSLKEMNDPQKTGGATVASVMDYTPTNIVPKSMKQGDFYPTTIGPYDIWAIEYGYTPFSGGTNGEVKNLQEIAARSGAPGLAFATDEDTRGIDPDPHSNRFDLGSDTVEYARQRAALVAELMPGFVERVTEKGETYDQARRTFNVLLSTHGQAMFYAARYVGGIHLSRSHKGDKDAPPPIVPVNAKKQREALALLEEQVFSDKPFQFPPEIFKYLTATKWLHWGTSTNRLRPDFPVHDVVLMWQDRILEQLMSSVTLTRLHDMELKIAADQDALTAAELLERLTKAIFKEVDELKPGKYTARKPAITSLRRNLQRAYLKRLSLLALGRAGGPSDCQTVAYAELSGLRDRIEKQLKQQKNLDSYSRAHLLGTSAHIEKVLDAGITLPSP